MGEFIDYVKEVLEHVQLLGFKKTGKMVVKGVELSFNLIDDKNNAYVNIIDGGLLNNRRVIVDKQLLSMKILSEKSRNKERILLYSVFDTNISDNDKSFLKKELLLKGSSQHIVLDKTDLKELALKNNIRVTFEKEEELYNLRFINYFSNSNYYALNESDIIKIKDNWAAGVPEVVIDGQIIQLSDLKSIKFYNTSKAKNKFDKGLLKDEIDKVKKFVKGDLKVIKHLGIDVSHLSQFSEPVEIKKKGVKNEIIVKEEPKKSKTVEVVEAKSESDFIILLNNYKFFLINNKGHLKNSSRTLYYQKAKEEIEFRWNDESNEDVTKFTSTNENLLKLRELIATGRYNNRHLIGVESFRAYINSLISVKSSDTDEQIYEPLFIDDLFYVKFPFYLLTKDILESSETDKLNLEIIHNVVGEHQIFLAYKEKKDIHSTIKDVPVFKLGDGISGKLIEDTIVSNLEKSDLDKFSSAANLISRREAVSKLVVKWKNESKDEINFVSNPISLVDGKVNGVLGVSDLANDIYGIIKKINGMEKGVMFGIFGKWGRGKTFLWNKIAELIKQDKESIFEISTFHAWKYQDTPASWAYLYETLADSYYGTNSIWKYFKKIKLNFVRLGYRALLYFIFFLSITVAWYFFIDFSTKLNWILNVISGIGVGVLINVILIYNSFSSRAIDLFDTYSQKVSFSEYLGVQSEIQRELKYLLKAWLGKTEKRILIFVDDIDRCRENKIIEIIDSFRVMLEEENIHDKIVVIAAIDESILKMAIRSKYHHLVKEKYINDNLKLEQEEELSNLTNEYMDKLFLAGIKLPVLSQENKREFLNELMKGKIGEYKKKNIKEELIKEELSKEKINENVKETLSSLLKMLNVQSSLLLSANRGGNIVDTKIVTDDTFEILSSDKESIDSALLYYSEATPRQIRILVYRHLLARKILQKRLHNKRLLTNWYELKISDYLSLYIIEKSLANSSSIHKTQSESILLGRKLSEFNIDESIMNEIKEVIDLVVAY